jgi:hypothetical protein
MHCEHTPHCFVVIAQFRTLAQRCLSNERFASVCSKDFDHLALGPPYKLILDVDASLKQKRKETPEA